MVLVQYNDFDRRSECFRRMFCAKIIERQQEWS
jgi:hypothetical protein